MTGHVCHFKYIAIAISDYISGVIVCPCHDLRVAQVAQNCGCSNIFVRVEYFGNELFGHKSKY